MFDSLSSAGATCIFEETGELIGCEQVMASRAVTPELGAEIEAAVAKAECYYTTLGYGDVLSVKAWQMLGPITAMNGVLMFGWSTAVIFEVLRRSLEFDPAISRTHRRR